MEDTHKTGDTRPEPVTFSGRLAEPEQPTTNVFLSYARTDDHLRHLRQGRGGGRLRRRGMDRRGRFQEERPVQREDTNHLDTINRLCPDSSRDISRVPDVIFGMPGGFGD
jgi:hypothetical protein